MSEATLPDFTPLWLSIQLALYTVVGLFLFCTPLAWWLARTKSRVKPAIEAIVALPLVLPPTVIGFYLLILMGPEGWLGAPWVVVTGDTLAFSFAGLVIASMIYSMPFVVQPIQNAFEAAGRVPVETAATLGASPRDAFFSVSVPLASRGFLTAGVLGFAHTLGEFGIVLMVGGNIPGRTRVVSIAIYDHVETLNYGAAHVLSAGLLIFSVIVLIAVYTLNRQWRLR